MRIDPRRFAAVVPLALGATGCISTATRADLDRVSALVHAPLPNVSRGSAVASDTSEDARAILEQPLTADASVRVALLNNRALRASLREIGIARGQLVQAGLPPNPTVEVELRRPPAQGEALRKSFAVEYDLTSAILVPQRADAARADLEAARYRSAAAVVSTGYEVRAAFLALQAAMARHAIGSRVLDAFAAGRDAARALLAAGNIPELDFTTQEAAYQAARVTIAQLELSVLDRREQVNRLLGLHGEQTTWTADGTLPPVPEALDLPDDLERKSIQASLELAETRSRLEGIARRTGLARTEGWLPDLSVTLNAEQDGPGYTVGGGLRLTLPLFDRKQGTIAAREAELDTLLERYHGAAVDIRSFARELRNRVASTHARARHLQEVVVPTRRRVLEQAILQYNGMQIGVFQLLQARREELDAELGLVEAQRDFWTASAAVDALLTGRRVDLGASAAPAAISASSNESSGGH
ncbi:Hypothetical protein A7982_04053 [Minicystis rosea]|nr:Hypothetical protein A7982_04053 [Minicystis rosea]